MKETKKPKAEEGRCRGGRPQKAYDQLGEKRKRQLIAIALETLVDVLGDRTPGVIRDLHQKLNVEVTEKEKLVLGNLSEFFEKTPPAQRGVPAAILTKDLPLKEASSVTGVSMSVISVVRSQIRKGIFRIVKVFLFFDFEKKEEMIKLTIQQQNKGTGPPSCDNPCRGEGESEGVDS